MTHRALLTAGWLAMVSAFASIPLTFLSYRLGDNADPAATALQIGIQTAGALLFVAITLCLKKLLNARFGFHDADRSIVLMIVASVAASVMSVVALSFAQLKEPLEIASLVTVAFQGLVQLRFGYGLLRLRDDLDGMLRPFCYLNMATGVCVASVVLIVVGILVSAISDLMLGTIFFHIARLAREPDSGGTDTKA